MIQVEETRGSIPFVIVCPAGHVGSVQNCLVENDYFGLDSQKVWVLEEMKLPIVSMSSKLNSRKILLKSPWEILQKPAGTGVIFSLLSSNKILDTLNEMGVEYVQVRSSAVHLLVLALIWHSVIYFVFSNNSVHYELGTPYTIVKNEEEHCVI